MVGIVKQIQTGNRLLGGVFNKESVFQPIYQMLLAIHTAAFCCLSAKVELPFKMSLLQHAAVELPEESLHPVLAAMLANTMAVCSASEADILKKVSLVQSCSQSLCTLETGNKRKEKVFAGRRVWEASDRPWRPFSASHNDVEKQANCLLLCVIMHSAMQPEEANSLSLPAVLMLR